MRTRSKRVGRAGLLVSVAVLVLCIPAASHASLSDLLGLLRSTPSDGRAVFQGGNVVTCAGAGFPGTVQMGSPQNHNASDANVSGVVAPNSGTIKPGQGEEVNVTLVNPLAVIDAVVVKGGNGYNVYSTPSFLPPTLGPPQHYISPFNGGGNVPTISHWFVCYHLTTPPPTGSIAVRKAVIAPDGVTATALPTTFTATVTCGQQAVVVTLPGGGGVGTPDPALSGLAPGTICTVVEDTNGLPSGTVVSYDPPGADTTGVTISAGAGVEVTITNEYTNTPVQTGIVQITKVVVPNVPAGVVLPATFTSEVVCDDGTDVLVTMPGSGGPGTPIVHPQVNALCVLEETGIEEFPAQQIVSYSVDGGPPSTSQPTFVVTSATQTVNVTITNDLTAVSPAEATQGAADTVTVQPRFTG